MQPFHFLLGAIATVGLLGHSVSAFNPLSNSNVVNYWGQNSVSSTGGTETDLVDYCQDDTVDVFAIAFISQITNGQPVLNLADHCWDTFSGSTLLSCPKVGQDVQACQARGKAVVISIGGASGAYSLPDAQSGQAFADVIWNMFLGGSSDTRPFGDAVLDGVDIDLESGQNEGYVAFIAELRSKFASANKPYYITSAPQCPYPDLATQDALAASWFDLVWVQFYNNYCGVQSYGTSNFNFATWNNWATTVSLNPNVRILLGVPGGPGGAGSGVIGATTLNTILGNLKSTYSNFGGVMMWDAGIAKQSGLAASAAQFLHSSSGGVSGGVSPAPPKTTNHPITSPNPSVKPTPSPSPSPSPAPPTTTTTTTTATTTTTTRRRRTRPASAATQVVVAPIVKAPQVTSHPVHIHVPKVTKPAWTLPPKVPTPAPVAFAPVDAPIRGNNHPVTRTTTIVVSAATPTLSLKVPSNMGGSPYKLLVHVQDDSKPAPAMETDWMGRPNHANVHLSSFDILIEADWQK